MAGCLFPRHACGSALMYVAPDLTIRFDLYFYEAQESQVNLLCSLLVDHSVPVVNTAYASRAVLVKDSRRTGVLSSGGSYSRLCLR